MSDPNAVPQLVVATGELISPGPGAVWNIGANAGATITRIGDPDPIQIEAMFEHVFGLLLSVVGLIRWIPEIVALVQSISVQVQG